MKPLVSVVMANYNGSKHLEDSILSILNQSYKNFELIIIDDGSTDNSLNIIKKLQETDSRVKLIQNTKNLGLAASLNKGIEKSSGCYIARQDADDISTYNRLELQLSYIQEHKIDLLGTNVTYIDENSIEIVHEEGPRSESFCEALFSQQAIFPHGSAIMRKECLLELGGYNEKFIYTQDMELWLKFLKNDKIVSRLSEPLYKFRLQVDNTSIAKIYGQGAYTKALKKKYLENMDIDGELDKINSQISNLRNQKIKRSKISLYSSYYFSLLKYFLKGLIRYKGYYLYE